MRVVLLGLLSLTLLACGGDPVCSGSDRARIQTLAGANVESLDRIVDTIESSGQPSQQLQPIDAIFVDMGRNAWPDCAEDAYDNFMSGLMELRDAAAAGDAAAARDAWEHARAEYDEIITGD